MTGVDFIAMSFLSLADKLALLDWIQQPINKTFSQYQLNKLSWALKQYYVCKIPISYIVNKHKFYNRSFQVRNCLIPRYTTETLVAWLIEHYPTDQIPRNILDLGTGSGCIALSLGGEWTNSSITATDISLAALRVAKINQTNLAIPNVKFKLSNWFSHVHDRYDLLVSNPPYLSHEQVAYNISQLRCEPYCALVSQNQGKQALQHIIANSIQYTNDILLEHTYQQTEFISSELKRYGYIVIQAVKDTNQYVIGTWASRIL